MNPEEILKAKRAGFSDQEIADEIRQSKPNIAKAIDAGFTVEAIFEEPQIVVGDEKDTGEIIAATSKEPTLGRQAAAITANIAISEGAKLAGTAGGAAAGAAISAPTAGTAAPATIPVGAGIGYVSGALTGGFAGSIAEQKIEGKEDISYGRASVNALVNLIPGGIGKLSRGPKWLRRIAGVAAKRPVVTTAAIGGAVTPAQVAAERYVETGQLPSAEEMVKTGLVASVFGAGIGKTSEYGQKLLGRFAGKTEREINDLVRKGDIDAVNYIDAVSKNVDPDNFIGPEETQKLVGEIMQTAKARFAPSTVTGKPAAFEMIKAENVAMAGRETGAILNKKISRFIDASPDKQATEKLVYDYVTGAAGPMPRELAPIADDIALFRREVNSYQKQLVENHYAGQRTLPDLLLQKIEDSMNKGDYLTNEHEFFINPSYVPSAKATQKLKKKLVADGMSDAEAEKYIADLNDKRPSGPDEIERFVYSQNAGILKQRKELSPELREYLGEVKGVGERMEGTMSKLSRLVAYDTADLNIKTILRSAGIAKVAGEGIEELDFVPLNLRRGLANIDGEQLYVPKQFQTAINHLYGMGVDEVSTDWAIRGIKDIFGSGVALAKASKVLMNPPSYMVQVYGNIINVLGQGANPFKGFVKGSKAGLEQFTSIAKRSSAESLAQLKRYKELGLVGQGVTLSDIRSGLEGGIGRNMQKALNPIGKAYSVPDIAFRVSLFENNLSFIRKAAPSANLDKAAQKKAEDIAAAMTNATYQNYDYLNESLKSLSRYGGLGQFAAFSMELMRNQYNQGKLAIKMMNGGFADELQKAFGSVDRKAIQMEGAKRIGALASVYAATAAGVQLWNRREAGIDEKQETALRESVLPEWESNRPLAFDLDDKSGDIYWMNTSYLVPHAQMAAPFLSALREEDPKQAITKGLATWLEDVGGEGNFFINALVPAIQNYDPKTSQPISKSTNQVENALERSGWFAGTLWTPGFKREFDRATSETDPQSIKQTALRQAGLRWNNTTIEDGARFKINAVKENLASLASDYSYARYKKVGDDLAQEYQSINKNYRDNVQLLGKHASNYRTLGKTNDEIIRMFRDNGIGAATALAAVDGEVLDLPQFKSQSTTEIYESLPAGRKEKEKAIREYSKKDPFRGKALIEKHKQVLRDDALNISERDKAIRSLGADDGTRARYIFKKMKESSNPDALLRDYIKRRLVNQEVLQQIDALKKTSQ